MKPTLFVLPLLAVALTGCSSNTTAPVDTATTETTNSNARTTAPGANGIPTPFVRNSGTSNTGNPAVAPQVPAPNTLVPGAMPGGKMPQVPPGMAMGSNTLLSPTKELDAQIAAAQKSGDKKKLAQALANRGTLRMNDGPAAPRVKYRAALVDYRAALQADPNNAEAKANKKLIENIYTSMGRPVPQ